MYKRLLITSAVALFLLPVGASAATSTPADFLPKETIGTLEISIHGKLKEVAETYLNLATSYLGLAGEESGTNADEDPRVSLLVQKLLNGDTFTLAVMHDGPLAEDVTMIGAVALTAEEWNLFNAGQTPISTTFGEYYKVDDDYWARLGDYAVLANDLESLQIALNLANNGGETLSSDTHYRSAIDAYIAGSYLNLSVNFNGLAEVVRRAQAEGSKSAQRIGSAVGEFEKILKLFKYETVSVGPVAEGYAFSVKVVGDSTALADAGLALDEGGSFTPSLFNRMPNARPIIYFEANNLKKQQEQEERLLQKLVGGETDIQAFYEKIYSELPLSPRDVANVLTGQYAFALQERDNDPTPYITFYADVSKTRAQAMTLLATLESKLQEVVATQEKGIAQVEHLNSALFKATFDLEKIEGYDGPQIEPLVFLFGVTADNHFFISNFPNFDRTEVRTGFANDPDFRRFNPGEPNALRVAYFNPRNMWNLTDQLLAKQDERGGRLAAPFSFYVRYYHFVSLVYSIKDVFIRTTGTQAETTVKGTVAVDEATRISLRAFMKERINNDSDNDGVSDYDELYRYGTSIKSADCDGDGTTDIEALRRGNDPCSGAQLFHDSRPDAYYTDEVAFLTRRGAISGYKDGTFKADLLVNRAEFVQMVVKAFDQNGTAYLGTGSSALSPFDDVSPTDWFAPAVAQAYSAGLVKGNLTNGQLLFRPGDPINRAEAITILNQVSIKLQSTLPDAVCRDSAFDDISQNDWFCENVVNGYKNGVTSGRSTRLFAPDGFLNRGEAAVMILRTFEKDAEFTKEHVDEINIDQDTRLYEFFN
ncbi:hypothetical protein CO046_00845 [Candidatus Peregrinibacteria bacterium CG_4_9_14_0_2_um_filter_53_11]|nr:MAG: hypothetical protein CO046_00845 [Candidatus Peregrinibacteria bacterium CG_4_9_14_0_2_um_filter_53_11]